MFKSILIILVLLISSCAGLKSAEQKQCNERATASEQVASNCDSSKEHKTSSFNDTSLNNEKALEKFSMGSCNKPDLPQPLWPVISSHNPELFFWLGDNVYLDTENTEVMKAIYQKQLSNKGYSEFIKKTPVIGIWDDHDYGMDNVGKEFPKKVESQKLFLDFMNEPLDSPRRKQEGIYTTYTYGPEGKQVRFILLDVRYNRDEPNKKGSDILGEEQWKWLHNVLNNNKAQVTFIASGISVLSGRIPTSEEWVRFKESKAELFGMLKQHETEGVMILTGDRHFSGTLKKKYKGTTYHELMSSGMTHTIGTKLAEKVYTLYYGKKNSVIKKSFANIEINWNVSPIELSFKAIDVNNAIILRKDFELNESKKWVLK